MSKNVRIGFYLNHHGKGHTNRFLSLYPFLKHSEISVLSSDITPFQELPIHRVAVPDPEHLAPTSFLAQCDMPASLHSAPLGSRVNAGRTVVFSQWIQRWKPDLFIVDVSVEVMMIARLCGAPCATIRMHGNRNDNAHLEGYRNAVALLAPFSKNMEQDNVPSWVIDKTIYCGGFSRFNNKLDYNLALPQGCSATLPNIIVISGFGGSTARMDDMVLAAQRWPEYQWVVLGPLAGSPLPADPNNLCRVGIISNPVPYYQVAHCVIADTGHNTVMEIAECRVPFICIPQERPFNEQHYKAEILERIGLAVYFNVWNEVNAFETVLQKARQLDLSGWSSVMSPNGAENMAAAILNLASECKVA